MTSTPSKLTRACAASGLFSLLAISAVAQQAPSPAAAATAPRTVAAVPTAREVQRPPDENPAAKDAPLVISPFEVRPEEDEGYQATSTLAGTRLRSDLKDLAASISVVTKDFMNDVNATDLTSLLVYTLGTEVGGFGGNFSDLSNPEAQGVFDDALGQATPGTRIRGLIGADRTRNYFQSDVPMDSYNNERVEINRGANANLFGLGSPSGIINSGIISADMRRPKTNVTAALGSYGSYRATFDHSQPLFQNRLALRLATMFDQTRYQIEHAHARKKGVTVTATYQPFKDTKLRVTSEWGRNDSNKPEPRPPFDRYSYWWDAGMPVWNASTGTGRLLGTPVAPWTPTTVLNTNGTRAGANYFTGNFSSWSANLPAFFYLDPSTNVMGGLNIGGGVTVDGMKGFADNSILNPAGTALMSGGMVGLASWSTVNQNVYQAGNPLRTLFNKQPMITDPAIFDFYNEMIAGPTKYEWAEWTTNNIALEQTFLNRDAGVEVAYDRQRMDNGFLSPVDYFINLDVNEILPNGAPNPNFLRPVSAGQGFKRVYSEDRDAWRATAFYALDLRRRTSSRWLSALLGRHRLQGTYSGSEKFRQLLGGTPWNVGLDWREAESQAGWGTASSGSRVVGTINYLGPSVAGTTSPSQLRAQGFDAIHDPSGVPQFTILYNRRPATTAVAARAPWAPATFDLISNGREDIRNTVRSSARYADRTEQKVKSLSFALQDHWLDGTLVTTFGWRRDQVWSYDAGLAPTTEFGTADMDWDVWYPKLTREAQASKSNWGAVGHLPKFIQRRLPWDTEASVFYNRASNFRVADQRYTITGDALPSETGETKEVGVRLSTFRGRLDVRVSRFETIADKATVGGFVAGLNQLAGMVSNVIDRNYGGNNVNNPAGIAAFESWLDGPYGKVFQNAFSSNFVPNNDAARPAAQYGRYEDASGNRGQISGVSALKSKGIELEVTLNPVRNWRISANVGSADAVRTKIAPELHDFLFNPANGVMTLVQHPDGTPTEAGRLIGAANSTQTLHSYVVANVVNNGMITTFAQDGTRSDELRKWNFRAVTNYTFSELFGGRLRGVSVGGAVRWADKPVLGYGGKIISSGGATLVVADVAQPYFSPNDPTYDLWFGYGRRLTNRIGWKVQLNLKNVGVGDELLPLAVNPDGTVTTWRIKEPQRFTLTNTFSF